MMILFCGGSASGKSQRAEERAVRLAGEGTLHYVATMQALDEESQRRVLRHRQMRAGKGFETVEQPVNIGGIGAQSGDVALIECVSNLLANEMFDEHGAQDACVEAVVEGAQKLLRRGVKLIVVTNDVFCDGRLYDKMTQLYLQRLGECNARLAQLADEVVEVVCGIEIVHKAVRQ